MSEASKKEPSPYEPRSTFLGSLVRNVFTLFFIGVAVACGYNVLGVGGEVEVMAKEVACAGQPMPCTAQYTMASRSPWAHKFKMYTSAKSGEMDIYCQRQYILVGDYSCKKEGAAMVDGDPAAAPSGASAPSSSGAARTPQKLKIPVPARPAASAATP